MGIPSPVREGSTIFKGSILLVSMVSADNNLESCGVEGCFIKSNLVQVCGVQNCEVDICGTHMCSLQSCWVQSCGYRCVGYIWKKVVGFNLFFLPGYLSLAWSQQGF